MNNKQDEPTELNPAQQKSLAMNSQNNSPSDSNNAINPFTPPAPAAAGASDPNVNIYFCKKLFYLFSNFILEPIDGTISCIKISNGGSYVLS